MRTAPFWSVDAFVGALGSRVLRGNPAAVVLLDCFPEDGAMQERASEFNLSETAFVVSRGDCEFDLRWFTPEVEVDLCGHATLAAAFALLDAAQLQEGQTARFETRSGELKALVEGERIELDFPVQSVEECALPDELRAALQMEKWKIGFCGRAADDWLLLVQRVELEQARPDFPALAQLDARGVILTALPEWPEENVDFLSRFFAPRLGVDEDPVTGSAHTKLAPFWAARLGKTKMNAVQLSDRGGQLGLEVRGQRVAIAGRCALRARGMLPPSHLTI